MFARVKQEYLERRLRQQQIEQMLGHKGNLVALPSTSAEEAGPSNALALCPANSNALGDQADASPGQGNLQYFLCFHWEILLLCSQSWSCLGDVQSQCLSCSMPGMECMCSWSITALQLTLSNLCLAQCLHLNLQCMLDYVWQIVTHAQNRIDRMPSVC